MTIAGEGGGDLNRALSVLETGSCPKEKCKSRESGSGRWMREQHPSCPLPCGGRANRAAARAHLGMSTPGSPAPNAHRHSRMVPLPGSVGSVCALAGAPGLALLAMPCCDAPSVVTGNGAALGVVSSVSCAKTLQLSGHPVWESAQGYGMDWNGME